VIILQCKPPTWLRYFTHFIASLPNNPRRDVGRVLALFGLPEEQHVGAFAMIVRTGSEVIPSDCHLQGRPDLAPRR
jgi:hypothetical protein